MTITAEAVRTRVSSLPVWDYDDNDEQWIRPIQEFDVVTKVDPDAVAWGRTKVTKETVTIGVDTPLYSGQDSLRLDVLNHYLDDRDSLFDPDGWFGTDHPVALPWEDGYLILDGNHRTHADRIMGRPTLAHIATTK